MHTFQVCFRLRKAALWRSQVTRARALSLDAMDELRELLAKPTTAAGITAVELECRRVITQQAHLRTLFAEIPVGSEHAPAARDAANLVSDWLRMPGSSGSGLGHPARAASST